MLRLIVELNYNAINIEVAANWDPLTKVKVNIAFILTFFYKYTSQLIVFITLWLFNLRNNIRGGLQNRNFVYIKINNF